MDYVAVEDMHAMQPQNGPHFNGSYTTHAYTTKQTPLPSDSESHYMEANCKNLSHLSWIFSITTSL